MFINESDGPITLDRLKDHYRHCIRLSASNKINAKNAFVLQLIDYMQDLVRQSEDGQMNFKIASSALDVGAKIYSHRVDCVHSEAQKVASSILMALDGQQQGKHQHDGSDLNDTHANNISTCGDARFNDSNEAEDGDNRPKKKRNVRNKNIKTIVEDENMLNGKLEKIVIGDAYLDGLSQDYDMSCPAALICYNALTQPNCILTIESNYLRKSYTETLIETAQCSQEPSEFVSLITKSHNCAELIQNSKSKKICSRLDNFLFNDRTTTVEGFNQNLDDSKLLPFNKLTDNNITINGQGEHGFDPEMYDNPNHDDFDDDMGVCEGNGREKKNEDDDILPNLDKIAASKPSEYGYINEPRLMNTWAGPYAWKGLKAPPQTAKKDVPPKTARKRTKLEQKPIDFNEDINESLEAIGGKEIRHSADAIRKWKKPMRPLDHNLTDEKVRLAVVRTFLRPEDTYNCPQTPAEALREVNKDHSYSALDNENNSISPDMNFDNVHDSDDEFRADPIVDGNELAIYGAQINNTLTQNADMEFAGENLIDQPFPVAQIHIPFAKVAKKMDVRKLKRVMWDLLSPPEKSIDVTVKTVNGEQDLETTVVPTATNQEKTISPVLNDSSIHLEFSSLYGDLPSRVSPKMSHDLSHPIAFVTLLHLANEKNLRLISKEDLKDFIIEQEQIV